jgi:hypothetical protein
MECLGLHNKPKAEVHLGHKLMGPKEEEEGDVQNEECIINFCLGGEHDFAELRGCSSTSAKACRALNMH